MREFWSKRAVVMSLVVALLGIGTGCKPRGSTQSDAAPPASANPSPPSLSKLPEPTPPAADLATEVPAMEAKLAADKAYATLWDAAHEKDRGLFLSTVSELLAEGAVPVLASKPLKEKQLFPAAVTLFGIQARVGHFPDAFTKQVEALIATGKNQPHRGLWKARAEPGPPMDWTALAMWLRNADVEVVRERVLAKKDGPFAWVNHKDPNARPWLTERAPVLTRLLELNGITEAVCPALGMVYAEQIGPDGKASGTCTAPPKPKVDLPPNAFTTKAGYYGAVSQAKLDRAFTLLSTDEEAYKKYVASEPGVFPTRDGEIVFLEDTSGLLASEVRVRRKGETTSWWTVREAIEQP